MDQVAFEQFVAAVARQYYASPRSTKIPTPEQNLDLAKVTCPSLDMVWVMRDFADFCYGTVWGDDTTQEIATHQAMKKEQS